MQHLAEDADAAQLRRDREELRLAVGLAERQGA